MADARNVEMLEIEEGDGSPPSNLDDYVQWSTARSCVGASGLGGYYQLKALVVITMFWVPCALHTYCFGFVVSPVAPGAQTGRVLKQWGDDGKGGNCTAEEIQTWGRACPELLEDRCNDDEVDLWEYRTPENSAKVDMDITKCSGNDGMVTLINAAFWYLYALGVLIGGWCGDNFGRKKTYFSFLAMMAVAAAGWALSTNVWALGFFRLLDAFGIGGYGMQGFVWASESINFEAQRYLTWVPGFWFVLGGCLAAILADWIPSWRSYAWVLSASCLPCLLIPFSFNESPKWLAAKKMRKEVTDVMDNISITNGHLPPAPPSDEGGSKLSDGLSVPEESPEGTGTFCHPKVLPRLAVTSCLWGIVSFSYYGLSLFAPPPLFPGKPVLDWCVGFIMEAPAFYISGFIGDSFLGRRGACAGAIAVGGLLLCIAGLEQVCPDDEPDCYIEKPIIFVLLYYVARMIISAGFAVVYPWSAELFPTSVRGACMGMNGFCARMGSSFAPVAGSVKPFPLRMQIFGIPTLAAGLAAWCLLPETRGTKLPGSVDDL